MRISTVTKVCFTAVGGHATNIDIFIRQVEADPMLKSPLVVKVVAPSSLAVPAPAVSSVFIVHLSLAVASAVA
jgi:hypothetical protein